MTEQERLLYRQQQRQRLWKHAAVAAKQHALGQNPGNYAEGQRVSDAYKQYQGAVKCQAYRLIPAPYQGQIDAACKKF